MADAKRAILRRLQDVEWRVLAGEPIDAVLLAWESSTLRSSFGPDLRVEDADAYKRLVASWGDESVSWRTTAEIIAELEHLVASGVAVYTIAGNSGRGAVNAYSFAEGVQTVGGREPDDEGLWISSNSFVDEVAQAAYRVRLVHGIDGEPLGYDVNEDGEPDVPVERVSSSRQGRDRPPRDGGRILKGSSFAAPAALRRHFVLQRARTHHPFENVSIR